MLTNSDLRELLNLFEKHKSRYLVVGAYAVMKYSEPRFTKDLDLWIATFDPRMRNSVYVALKEFGAPLRQILQQMTSPARITSIRWEYRHCGLILSVSIPGVEFEEAWKNREVVELDNLKIPFISRSDLIRAKEASGRPQDKIDIDRLREVQHLDALDEK